MLKKILFHNFRFVFAIDYWVKRRFTKGGMLLLTGLVTAIIFGIDTRRSFAYQLVAILFTLIIVASLSSLFFRANFAIKRRLPRFAMVGKATNYEIQIQNNTSFLQKNLTLSENIHSPLPSFEKFLHTQEPGHQRRNWFDNYVGYPRWIWLRRNSRGGNVSSQALPTLAPQSFSETTLTMTPLRRGYIYLAGLTFSRPDPFGLFYALHTIAVPDKLLVLPKPYPIEQISLSGTRKYQRGGVYLAMSVGNAHEFMALREYRPGDPLKHIHWRSFAKQGKPVVKEYQDEFFVRHALILDTFVHHDAHENFETAVSVAAAFVSTQHNQDSLLDLMFVGKQAYSFTGGRSVTPVDSLMEILACVEICEDHSFDYLAGLVMQHTSAISGAVCILLNWDDTRRTFIQTLKNRGIPLAIFVVTSQSVNIEAKFINDVTVISPLVGF